MVRSLWWDWSPAGLGLDLVCSALLWDWIKGEASRSASLLEVSVHRFVRSTEEPACKRGPFQCLCSTGKWWDTQKQSNLISLTSCMTLHDSWFGLNIRNMFLFGFNPNLWAGFQMVIKALPWNCLSFWCRKSSWAASIQGSVRRNHKRCLRGLQHPVPRSGQARARCARVWHLGTPAEPSSMNYLGNSWPLLFQGDFVNHPQAEDIFVCFIKFSR